MLKMSENLSNKTCGECKHYIAEMYHCTKNDVMAEAHNTCEDCTAKTITNGDKIRQMSNEDLAKKFGIHAMCDFCPAESADCGRGHGNIKYCRDAWLNWLNTPAESEGGEDE
jgi:hypothetical protein